jgi:hypothetical protein
VAGRCLPSTGKRFGLRGIASALLSAAVADASEAERDYTSPPRYSSREMVCYFQKGFTSPNLAQAAFASSSSSPALFS